MDNKFIKVEINADKVLAAIDKKGKDAINKIHQTNAQVGIMVLGEVRESIMGYRDEPKSFNTGHMANWATSMDTGDGAIVEQGTDYTIFLEEGTSKINARHHFRNSARRMEEPVREKYNEAIKSII